VEVAALERLVDDLGGAEVVLEGDVVALVLERLPVGLRNGLGAGEVLRPHRERLRLGRRHAAGSETHREGEQADREQCPRAAGSSMDHRKRPSVSGSSTLPTRNMLEKR